MALKSLFYHEDQTHELSIVRRKPELVIAVDGKEYTVKELTRQKNMLTLLINQQQYEFIKASDGEEIYLSLDGKQHTISFKDPMTSSQKESEGGNVIMADMPGVVVEVRTTSGKAVTTGETLMVVESMKIQTNIVAPQNGEVDEIHVEKNEAFDKGAALLSLKRISS